MKKCVFVGNHCFKKTKSDLFFIKILKKKFNVKHYYGLDEKIGVHNINLIKKEKADILVLFHFLPPSKQLKEMNIKKIIWLPLYDGRGEWRDAILKKITYLGLNIKSIIFLKNTYKYIKFFYPSLLVKYYPKPFNGKKSFSKNKLFFWIRNNTIDLEFAKKILNLKNFSKITIKLDKKIKINKKIKNLKIIDKWLSEKKYKKILKQHNIFIAPRTTEGIGFSFLNAMEQGLIIIANNKPTMNEYIIPEKTGFLFNFKNPKKINLNKYNLNEISKNSNKEIKKGYKIWIKQQIELLKWIETD